MSEILYVVESRTRTEWGWSSWDADAIGDNEPRSLAECEQDCRALPTLGADWAAAEYRVREVRP